MAREGAAPSSSPVDQWMKRLQEAHRLVDEVAGQAKRVAERESVAPSLPHEMQRQNTEIRHGHGFPTTGGTALVALRTVAFESGDGASKRTTAREAPAVVILTAQRSTGAQLVVWNGVVTSFTEAGKRRMSVGARNSSRTWKRRTSARSAPDAATNANDDSHYGRLPVRHDK
ncbi:unnamed protein product [Miscanthus lutarioriparius]|uniref:Uncharacterized protein n=1 Tax=Miscanthus lutarioriparius TaxID=422564 RepID=A0A811NYF8_9POAL|nr:unnamed protein product [Miscanthus lutarioriparius]